MRAYERANELSERTARVVERGEVLERVVVIVDKSMEVAGTGGVPHRAIGHSRVLTVERGSVVSETTTFAGDRVNSNSSVRSSTGGEMDAIPGLGNINNFPRGPVQLEKN